MRQRREKKEYRMKFVQACVLAVLIGVASDAIADELVFEAEPTTQVVIEPDKVSNIALGPVEGAQNMVKITRYRGVYALASKKYKILKHTKSGASHIFTSEDGSSMIKIIDARYIPRAKGKYLYFESAVSSVVGVWIYYGYADELNI